MERSITIPPRSFLLSSAIVTLLFSVLYRSAFIGAVGIVLDGGLCSVAPNVLTWTTATEVNTAGFNLYRSDRSGGSYTKINKEPIPASSDPLSGGKYQFEDGEVVAGHTYYYQLEDVEFNGTTSKHGPIVVTAQSTIWVCDHPEVSLALAFGGTVAVGAALYLVRRGRRSRQSDSTLHLVGKPD